MMFPPGIFGVMRMNTPWMNLRTYPDFQETFSRYRIPIASASLFQRAMRAKVVSGPPLAANSTRTDHSSHWVIETAWFCRS